MKNKKKILTLDERARMITEAFSETVLMMEGDKAFMTEQEQLNEIDFGRLKQKLLDKLPGIKGNAEQIYDGVKAKVGEQIGVAKEEINKPENQAKVKEVLNGLGGMMSKIKNAGNEVLSDPKKLQGLISTLNFSTYAALITGVAQMVFGSSLGIGAILSGGAAIGGIFFLKLALVLFIIKTILSVVKGVSTVGETLSNIGSFIKTILTLFDPAKNPRNQAPSDGMPEESYVHESLNESLDRLVAVHGY